LIIIIYLKSGNGKLLCVLRLHDIISYPKSYGFLCLVKNFCYYVIKHFWLRFMQLSKLPCFPCFCISHHFVVFSFSLHKCIYSFSFRLQVKTTNRTTSGEGHLTSSFYCSIHCLFVLAIYQSLALLEDIPHLTCSHHPSR